MDEEHGIEERTGNRKTALLVVGSHIGAAGVQSLLIDLPAIRLVAYQRQGPAAVRAAEQHKPSIILVGSDGVSEDVIVLLRQLRTASPESKIIVFSDEVERERLSSLWSVPIDGCLAWAEVTPENLQAGVDLAVGGARFLSAATFDLLLMSPLEGTETTALLSEFERMVIRGFDTMLNERQIAEAEHVSVRTVERSVHALGERLGVRTAYWIGRLVERHHLSE